MLDGLLIGVMLGIGLAAPLAMHLAARHRDRIGTLLLDGLPVGGSEALFPRFAFDPSGAHLHRIWHMLRDGELQWPWHDGRAVAQRRIRPDLAAMSLHRALLDILKQPSSYADAIRAGLDAPRPETLACPALLFDVPGDPAYAAARLAEARIVPRPHELAAATLAALPSRAPAVAA